MVSIVVPVYNMEKFLPRCMDTLVSQSSDYEIILVDDGSTDRSPELCDDYRPVSYTHLDVYKRQAVGNPK